MHLWLRKSKFTFHYVSIKSTTDIDDLQELAAFTFHYVSIKSVSHHPDNYNQPDLHSTMYLLNPLIRLYPIGSDAQFTFHYVSIKSVHLRRSQDQ